MVVSGIAHAICGLGHASTIMTANIYYHELKGEKAAALSRKPILTL